MNYMKLILASQFSNQQPVLHLSSCLSLPGLQDVSHLRGALHQQHPVLAHLVRPVKSPSSDSINFKQNSSFRLLFVVMFENLVAVTAMILKLAIPDISSTLKHKIRREVSEYWVYGRLLAWSFVQEYITKEIIIRTERLRKAEKNRQNGSNPELRRSHTVIPIPRSNSEVFPDHDPT